MFRTMHPLHRGGMLLALHLLRLNDAVHPGFAHRKCSTFYWLQREHMLPPPTDTVLVGSQKPRRLRTKKLEQNLPTIQGSSNTLPLSGSQGFHHQLGLQTQPRPTCLFPVKDKYHLEVLAEVLRPYALALHPQNQRCAFSDL